MWHWDRTIERLLWEETQGAGPSRSAVSVRPQVIRRLAGVTGSRSGGAEVQWGRQGQSQGYRWDSRPNARLHPGVREPQGSEVKGSQWSAVISCFLRQVASIMFPAGQDADHACDRSGYGGGWSYRIEWYGIEWRQSWTFWWKNWCQMSLQAECFCLPPNSYVEALNPHCDYIWRLGLYGGDKCPYKKRKTSPSLSPPCQHIAQRQPSTS